MKRVFIYRSERKQGAYLYLPDKDNFEEVPKSLIRLLGDLTFSFEFDLDENRRLMRAEAREVLRNIADHGFFLQLPPAKNSTETHTKH